MTEMERLEQLTKILQEGKTLGHEQTNTKVKLVNGHIFKFYPDGAIVIGSAIYNSECWTIEEPEPRFKITENQLAEYECRDGSKAVCWGVLS